MKRRRAREYALQLLFQHDFNAGRPDFALFWSDKQEDAKVREFAEQLVLGTLEHLKPVDQAIEAAAEHWVLERMAAVDRNVLRAATYELLFRPDIPPAVTINEALEIAKKFSTTDSASFINGILDRISHRRPDSGGNGGKATAA